MFFEDDSRKVKQDASALDEYLDAVLAERVLNEAEKDAPSAVGDTSLLFSSVGNVPATASDEADELMSELDRLLQETQESAAVDPFASISVDDLDALISETEKQVQEAAEALPLVPAAVAAAAAKSPAVAQSVEEARHLDMARRALLQTRAMLDSVIELLGAEETAVIRGSMVQRAAARAALEAQAEMYEGTFNGESLVTSDGKEFHVPANYASKSRLVEGDLMKLHILDDGSHVYKQVGPAQRERIKGRLLRDDAGGYYYVSANGRRYRLQTAAVTFHRGRPGDEVTALIPRGMPARYAAVESILHV